MENTIATRIYDFLKQYPPFNLLEEDLLMRVSGRVVVQYRQPGEVIFRRGEKPGLFIYIVREGAVSLVNDEGEEEVLVDECDEGDVFGIRPLLADDEYVLTAKAAEESLIYAINIEGYTQVLTQNPKVAFYLATNMAAGLRRQSSEKRQQSRLFLDRDEMIDGYFSLVEIQSVDHSKDPVTCREETPIRQAAAVMSERQVGSILVVNGQRWPVGIVTDKDLRREVATGKTGLDEPVSRIMSSPVITGRPDIALADIQILMVKHRIHHLCLTEDGTISSPVTGVISEHDLLILQGNNPAVMIRQMRRSRNARDLKQIRERAEDLLRKYIYQEVSIAFISTVMTEINDALIQRIIELSQRELQDDGSAPPAVAFCWLALGSEGRQEQLLRTDQDNALVFENIPDEQAYTSAKEYFLRLAAKVTAMLQECGFEYCPGDMMASNPRWCLSLDEWKAQFSRWIFEPTPKAVLHSTIFFDYRPVYGDVHLAEALTDHIFEAIDRQTVFLSFLAQQALRNPPPLTFFRNFVVERGGEHKDAFDIKARAMMPLTDAARVLILSAKVGKINNTFRRFEKLAELEPQNKELYEQAADAYEVLMRYRTLQGLKNQDSGRYFDPSQLSKMERLNLRNSFQPIDELQSLLRTRFQLAFLGG